MDGKGDIARQGPHGDDTSLFRIGIVRAVKFR
jgi:hypothetical protein